MRVEKHTRVNVTVAVADATVGYEQFKRVASEAVRVPDMRVVVSEEQRTRQSTLANHSQVPATDWVAAGRFHVPK